MERNGLRRLFNSEDVAIGMLIGIPTPTIVDLAACAGIDYFMLDTEHCTYGIDVLEHMVMAANHRGAATLVRLPTADPDAIARVLDVGVDGVKFSKVESREEAEQIVSYCRLPPYGTRSPEPATRSANYGMMDRAEYDRAANDTVVVVGVDTRVGLENVDEIVSTPGVDAVQVGPSDFSWSMGIEKDSQEFYEAATHIATAARKAGATPIRVVYTPEQIGEWLERDPDLHVFHWAADKMNISKFFKAGVDRGKEIARKHLGQG